MKNLIIRTNNELVNLASKTLLVLLMLIVSGCASIPVVPEKGKSTIAITIDIDVHARYTGFGGFKPEKVFYIKLDNKDDTLKKEQIIAYGYRNCPFLDSFGGGCTDTFLLNTEPGVYAAVGAYGKTGTVFTTIFFPEDVIKSTIVTVGQDSLVYMGRYVFYSATLLRQMETPDDYQNHYYKRVLSNYGDLRNLITPASSLYFAVKTKEKFNSAIEEKRFLNKYIEMFKNTELENEIINRLNELNSFR